MNLDVKIKEFKDELRGRLLRSQVDQCEIRITDHPHRYHYKTLYDVLAVVTVMTPIGGQQMEIWSPAGSGKLYWDYFTTRPVNRQEKVVN